MKYSTRVKPASYLKSHAAEQETVYIHFVCDMHKDMKSLLIERLMRDD